MTWKPFLQKNPPTDKQRSAFVHRLEQQYRLDYRFYAGTGPMQYGGRTVESLGLPRSVLERFYNGNARRIILRQHGRSR